MKKFISAILLTAMLLTACGKDGTATTEITTATETVEAATETIEINGEFVSTSDIISSFFGDYISNPDNVRIIEGEQSEALTEAFRNVYINNSRFAFPMLVGELPECFELGDYSETSDIEYDGFYSYRAPLNYNGEYCATVYILQKEGTNKGYGIIYGLIAMSSFCKWDFNGIVLTQDTEKIIDILGEPSSYENIGDTVPSILYFDEKGNMLLLPEQMNTLLCISTDILNAADNSAFVEYIPYDDFDNIPEVPELSGEPREIDWNMLFEDDCIIIGNDKYPANARISDLSDDIMLFEYSIDNENRENPDYTEDTYIAMYKGREFAMLSALRLDDEPIEDAVISSWTFTFIDSYLFPASVMGIPFYQTLDVRNFFTGYNDSAGYDDINIYKGVIERENMQYCCCLGLMSNTVHIYVIPRSANPEYYNELVNSQ